MDIDDPRTQEEKEEWEKFSKENFIIAIGADGKITSVPFDKADTKHYQLFSRLNEKLGGVMGEVWWNSTSLDLPNTLAKKDFIVIFPLDLEEIGATKTTLFPFKPTKKQLNAFKTLYEPLKKMSAITYYKSPSEGKNLNYGENYDFDFENLDRFVNEKLAEAEIEENSKIKAEKDTDTEDIDI